MKGDEGMVTERMQKAFDAMQGMTYLEWSKFSHVIDRYYEAETAQRKIGIALSGSEGLPEMFRRLF